MVNWKKVEETFDKHIKECSEDEFWEFVKTEFEKPSDDADDIDGTLIQDIIGKYFEDMPDEEYWKIIMKYKKRKEIEEECLNWESDAKRDVLKRLKW